MIWESWSDFFAMGGYGLYVWGSTVVVAVFMCGEILVLNVRRKAILAQLKLAQRAVSRKNKEVRQ